jgi:hypothetical protein
MSTNFSTASASIKAANFGHFLVFVRGRDCPQLSRDRVAAFLFISTQLGNDPLVLDLLSSLEPAAVSSNVSPSADSATKQKLFGEMTIDACALQFDFYPAEDILLLYCQTLHRLVSPLC